MPIIFYSSKVPQLLLRKPLVIKNGTTFKKAWTGNVTATLIPIKVQLIWTLIQQKQNYKIYLSVHNFYSIK